MLSRKVAHKMYQCLGLSHPRDRTSCFFLLNFMRFLLSHVPSLSRSFYEWQCNCWCYQQLLPLYLQIALGAACPIIQVIDEHVKQHYPNVHPWGTSLVTALQLDVVMLIRTIWAQFSQFSTHLTAHLSSLYFTGLPLKMFWESLLRI